MGWESSTRRGGGRKVRALPRKFVFLGFRREESGMSGNFAGMSRTLGGVQKVCAKEVRAHFSFPIIFQELMSVIISPPITPNKFWGFNKRNSQEKLHHLSCPY